MTDERSSRGESSPVARTKKAFHTFSVWKVFSCGDVVRNCTRFRIAKRIGIACNSSADVQVLSPAPTKEVQPSVVVLLLFIRVVGLEVGAVLNDSPVDCQSRE